MRDAKELMLEHNPERIKSLEVLKGAGNLTIAMGVAGAENERVASEWHLFPHSRHSTQVVETGGSVR
jgi:hypothetical protein